MTTTRQEGSACGPLAAEEAGTLVAASGQGGGRAGGAGGDSRRGAGERAVLGQHELNAAFLGHVVERAVGAAVAVGRVEEVALADVLAQGLVGLLALDRAAGEVPLGEPGGDLVSEDRVDGRQSNP